MAAPWIHHAPHQDLKQTIWGRRTNDDISDADLSALEEKSVQSKAVRPAGMIRGEADDFVLGIEFPFNKRSGRNG